MRCINCLSTKTVKNGFDNKGFERFKCNGCEKRFCDRGFFARFRHKPKDIIKTVYLRLKRLSLRETSDAIARLIYIHVSHVTVWNWCMKFISLLDRKDIINTVYLRLKRLSLRETSDAIARLIYIHVSHVTVWNWCMKFISLLVLWASLINPNYEKLWHVDEKFIRVRGSKDKFAYLFVVCDSKNKILATYVANSRSGESAKIVLQKARTNNTPEIIVTDGMQGYKKACKIFGRKVKHVVAHFKPESVFHDGKILLLSNNRIERINSDINLFLHVFRGLKSFRTAELWLQGFMIYHNYLKPSRISWHKIPKMITCRRQVMTEIIFCVYSSPFQLTESSL